jgi:hypothetical protein
LVFTGGQMIQPARSGKQNIIETFRNSIEHIDPEISANVIIGLIQVVNRQLPVCMGGIHLTANTRRTYDNKKTE